MHEAGLVVAAQAGDRRALEELGAAYLPLVYNVVGRALSGQPDADDIVQETMLRAIRELGSLRDPGSFRAWLTAIAVRQLSTHLRRRRIAAHRTAALDEVVDVPDAGANFEDLTILCLGLSGQRRQAVLASRWLDAEHRALLSLWWLETAGQLTRPELASALGLTVAHAGVRVQRMLDQLARARVLVAALAMLPRCAELSAAAAGWDGRPSPLWRKRIGRHVRACAACAAAGDGMIPAARLLAGVALVPVPLTLTAALIGKSALSGSAPAVGAAVTVPGARGTGLPGARPTAGIFSRLGAAVGAHPVAAVLLSGAIVAGTVGAVALRTNPSRLSASTASVAPDAPATASTPATSAPLPEGPGRGTAGLVPLGPMSLESADEPGRFVMYVGDLGALARVGTDSGPVTRQAATFDGVPGLADAHCVSLRSRDGRYLRHSSWRLRLMPNDGTVLFRQDATFCPEAGSAGSISLESFNYPGRFLRHVGDTLWVDQSDGSASFRADDSFLIRSPLAR
jgi:RNA polymerase sigma factor (sigma-70 family)